MSLVALRFKDCPQLENAALNSPALVRGASGDGVQILQQALKDLKYKLPKTFKFYDTPDGVYGTETKDAVIAFQKDVGLTKDGKVGANTMAELDKKFKDEHIKVEPPPPPALIDYLIPGRVRTVNQDHWFDGGYLCWAACLTMMFNWRDQKEHNTRDLLSKIGLQYRLMFEAGMSMKSGMWWGLVRDAGMNAMERRSMSAFDWEVMLRRYGMLWVGAMSDLSSSAEWHSFIMTGLMIGPTGQQHMRLINPSGGRTWNITFTSFTEAYERAATSGYPQIRYFS